MADKYHLFISHSWSYSDAYERLVALLNQSDLVYSNYSVPKSDPIHTRGTDKELYNAIKQQIACSSVVIILAGVYASYSKWIDKEIAIAKNEFLNAKPILAIEPFGSEKTSVKVKDNANEVVKWNTNSIVNAIKRLC